MTIQKSIHIAILDADVPVPSVYENRGLYSTQFRGLLRDAACRLNSSSSSSSDSPDIDIQTSSFDAVGRVLPPFTWLRTSPRGNTNEQNDKPTPIDAILITGSAASANEAPSKPWIQGLQDFVQRVYTDYPEVRIFGSCFGHQVVARGLLDPVHRQQQHGLEDGQAGLKVEKSPEGYEVGLYSIALTPEFVSSFPRVLARQPEPRALRLQLIHGDRVVPIPPSPNPSTVSLPPGWVNIGSTPLSPIQGLYNPHRVLTYQGHFEFDSFVNRELCHEFGRRGGWTQEVVEGFVKQIENVGAGPEDDSKAAAELVVLFFAGES